MKNFRVQFSKIDSDSDFHQFAKDVGGVADTGDILNLQGRMAQGTVKKIRLNNGFYLRAWNMILHHPVELCRLGDTSGTGQNGFSVIYIFTPRSCVLKSLGEHSQFNKSADKSTLLVSDDVTTIFDIQSHQPVQLIDFSITSCQAMEHFNLPGLPFESLFKDRMAQQLPLILLESSSASISLTAHQVFDICLRNPENIDRLQKLSFSFISNFLQKTITRNWELCPGKPAVHFDKIIEAEAIVQSHLQKNLPKLEEIAHQLALSESTLKRHFKVTFGKSIYEYYLEKKMDLAMHLLREKPLSVNEVAEMVGYEKVSNFIDIFKKHHGYSPGSMKKRGYMDI